MGTFNANILPTTTGLSLGSAMQQWLVNGSAPLVSQVNSVGFSSTPAFIGTSAFSVFTMILSGNVTSSTFSAPIGLVLFQITQDNTGGRTFAWPASFQQPGEIGSAANQTTTQLFYFDGTLGWPLASEVLTP